MEKFFKFLKVLVKILLFVLLFIFISSIFVSFSTCASSCSSGVGLFEAPSWWPTWLKTPSWWPFHLFYSKSDTGTPDTSLNDTDNNIDDSNDDNLVDSYLVVFNDSQHDNNNYQVYIKKNETIGDNIPTSPANIIGGTYSYCSSYFVGWFSDDVEITSETVVTDNISSEAKYEPTKHEFIVDDSNVSYVDDNGHGHDYYCCTKCGYLLEQTVHYLQADSTYSDTDEYGHTLIKYNCSGCDFSTTSPVHVYENNTCTICGEPYVEVTDITLDKYVYPSTDEGDNSGDNSGSDNGDTNGGDNTGDNSGTDNGNSNGSDNGNDNTGTDNGDTTGGDNTGDNSGSDNGNTNGSDNSGDNSGSNNGNIDSGSDSDIKFDDSDAETLSYSSLGLNIPQTSGDYQTSNLTNMSSVDYYYGPDVSNAIYKLYLNDSYGLSYGTYQEPSYYEIKSYIDDMPTGSNIYFCFESAYISSMFTIDYNVLTSDCTPSNFTSDNFLGINVSVFSDYWGFATIKNIYINYDNHSMYSYVGKVSSIVDYYTPSSISENGGFNIGVIYDGSTAKSSGSIYVIFDVDLIFDVDNSVMVRDVSGINSSSITVILNSSTSFDILRKLDVKTSFLGVFNGRLAFYIQSDFDHVISEVSNGYEKYAFDKSIPFGGIYYFTYRDSFISDDGSNSLFIVIEVDNPSNYITPVNLSTVDMCDNVHANFNIDLLVPDDDYLSINYGYYFVKYKDNYIVMRWYVFKGDYGYNFYYSVVSDTDNVTCKVLFSDSVDYTALNECYFDVNNLCGYVLSDSLKFSHFFAIRFYS